MAFTTQQYTRASDFLAACATSLRATRAAAANLPLASSYALVEEGASPDMFGPADDNIWLSVTSKSASKNLELEDTSSDSTEHLFTFMLIGPFPGVFACSHDPSLLPSSLLTGVTSAFVHRLEDLKVPAARLQSVFGPTLLTRPFATYWAALHSLTVKPEPVLDAHLAIISRNTLTSPTRPLQERITLGKATIDELDIIARMNRDFAQVASPHPLDMPAARKQAEYMIKKGQLFVARLSSEAEDDNENIKQAAQVQAVVAVVPKTPGIKSVSIVWTELAVRGMGLAEALVRYSCGQMLQNSQPVSTGEVDQICLHVEPSNPAAVKVYKRVGFLLDEHWTEYGWEGVALRQFV
jgi:ribosomal protein S18 acetylase RimI-like enzyme